MQEPIRLKDSEDCDAGLWKWWGCAVGGGGMGGWALIVQYRACKYSVVACCVVFSRPGGQLLIQKTNYDEAY